VAAVLTGCSLSRQAASPSATPPAEILGDFIDDYNTRYRITTDRFLEGRTTYRIVEWQPTAKYLLAQHTDSTGANAARWSRFDWVLLPDQGMYRWGYCHSAWRAPSLDSARHTLVVNRDDPRRGCNGHPFTRMRREAAERGQNTPRANQTVGR
jgi:hypothetical protein